MIFHETTLKDAWLIDVEPRGDERGMFARTFCRQEFEAHGLLTDFVQQNMSVSAQAGTIRGMHYQRPPHTEAKLVRCVRGRILDVIVDMRSGSPTYLKHEGFELSADNRRQLYVPPGFAHSFQTLVDDIEVSYLVTAPYTPEAEGGVRYSDPLLAISWPLPVTTISDKDANWPLIDLSADSVF
ncbi:dTDP-4-dehydrorhamnose 3,5-epimerase [Sphingomonas histidinilytica]|jgi:dTDP-4-dehydrorhamnose 3,5-epimerase|uniref:dTDP-4-dehydrorhamnose 3,5-epimerase n=1 Tax=Rhizorhabdus histidinilytica TaxID=439228 RepID=A0A1T5CJY5_9SPHN|nr:dTDP-4-dehydrorhamnose 3,5-epimerase [Rhizorhabdus histidinilytica]MBO9378330.1 dTDP-4-dehydrorhamnose 3,5-epimerase [Rhizorhabdus histidinilytica]QEH78902.1 dTDP-4-dehydrorhamnose 3,5-epimerase [Sphingomonas sp. C8-2]SKB59767.1 dTDP-4-dehydrorhamnose 3,5-epimerase [Rhizorhabdus histidinilytica]